MFDKTDPRATLKGNEASKNTLEHEIAGAKVVKFYEQDPIEIGRGSKSWWSRGQNFHMDYTEAVDGEVFNRKNQVDEYAVILPDKHTSAVIKNGSEELRVDGNSLIFVPAGESDIKLLKGGRIIRLFTSLNEDLKDLSINKDAYEQPDQNVAPFQAWPSSPADSKIRAYSLDVAPEEGRFGRIFRSSTFMINFLDINDGPRDATKLSPHSHDDFEQCSLILEGEYLHHLRWPWTPNKNQWKNDLHVHCGSPSATVIPPGVIHTSEAIGTEANRLIDIFCPPRLDFSKKDGWVLNDSDYPLE